MKTRYRFHRCFDLNQVKGKPISNRIKSQFACFPFSHTFADIFHFLTVFFIISNLLLSLTHLLSRLYPFSLFLKKKTAMEHCSISANDCKRLFSFWFTINVLLKVLRYLYASNGILFKRRCD